MSWPMVKLGKLATINPRLPKDTDEQQEVSFVGMASASEDGKLLNEEIRVLSDTKKGFTYFTEDDVLLAKITPCFENGKCLQAGQISKPIGFGSTEFHVVRANPELLDSKYLFYMVWSNTFRFYGQHSMSGAAGQKRVSADFIKNYEIPHPPLQEQKRIAAILDKADAIRRKRQQAIELADEFLRSVFLDMFGDPVVNPKGWEIKKIGDFCTFQGGYAFKSANYVSTGIPLVKITNVHLEDLDWTEVDYIPANNLETRKDFLLKPGDLIMAMTRPVIKSLGTVKLIEVKKSDTPCFLNQRVGRFKNFEDTINKDYLKHFLLSDYFKAKVEELCSVALQPNISSKQVEDISISIPNIALQNRFSKVVESTYQIKKDLTNSLKDTDDMLQSLKQKAFSGAL